MRATEKALAIIKFSESCRLKAYPDTGGVWTIGWGHTRGVKEGDTCTQAQADAWLVEDVGDAERIIARHVLKPLTQNQFDGLVPFVYNIGAPQFIGSTMLRLLNRGQFTAAADQYPRWKLDNGDVQPGLIKRRAAERALFLTP